MTVNDKQPPFDASEWEAQEQGLGAARGAIDPSGRDAADYHLVSMAVASAPRHHPPPDFAAKVVAAAGVRDSGPELALVRSLLLILAAASILTIVPAAGPAWEGIRESLAAGGLPWAAVAGACVAATWGLNQIRQIRTVQPQANQH